MKPQHLSDEAVAAFADGVLSGHARERAARHLDACPECRRAVKEQREAAAALRTAPAPALPTSLADRLRTLPMTTPLPPPSTSVGPDGNAVLSTFAPMAAFAPTSSVRSKHRGRTYFTAAVLAGVTGAIVAGAVGSTSDDQHPGSGSSVQPVNHVQSGAERAGEPVSVFHGGTRP
jgi:anti-sigma factor RsiW